MLDPVTATLIGSTIGTLGGILSATVAVNLNARHSRNLQEVHAAQKVYFDALEMLARSVAAMPWSGPDIPSTRVPEPHGPTESDINYAIMKVALYAKGAALAPALARAAAGGATPVSLAGLVAAFRAELGTGPAPFAPKDYLYVFLGRDRATSAARVTEVHKG